MNKKYEPTESDLVTVAENHIEAIDAALRHGRYFEAERLSADLIKTLIDIQHIRFGVEEV